MNLSPTSGYLWRTLILPEITCNELLHGEAAVTVQVEAAEDLPRPVVKCTVQQCQSFFRTDSWVAKTKINFLVLFEKLLKLLILILDSSYKYNARCTCALQSVKKLIIFLIVYVFVSIRKCRLQESNDCQVIKYKIETLKPQRSDILLPDILSELQYCGHLRTPQATVRPVGCTPPTLYCICI